MKKKIVCAFVAVSIFFVLGMPYWLNDIACGKYKKEIECVVQSVEGVDIIAMFNECGNEWNGDHTSMIVKVLGKGKFSEKELCEKFSDADILYAYGEFGYDDEIPEEFCEYIIGVSNEYFLLRYRRSAPFSWLDLRGH